MKNQCKFTKRDGTQCGNKAEPQSDFCWIHRDDESKALYAAKSGLPTRGPDNSGFVHGLQSAVMQMPCTERCYMYDICEVKTDDPEGKSTYGGICYYELEHRFDPESLLDLDGLKEFMANHLIQLDRRISRGVRFELVTGGYLSEPEISSMQRNLSSVGFGMLQIMEKEQFAAIQEDVKKLKQLYEKHVKSINAEKPKR
jgi:hypothetical protein